MKLIFTLLLLCGIHGLVIAQKYDVLNYNLNATPVNGVKIKTNLPFTNTSQMPTIIFEGYNFGSAEPVGLILTYYVYNDVFYNSKISSFGAYTPPVYLANENGKVVIFLDSKVNYQRFTVRVYAQGRSAEIPANFAGWTAVDELIDTTATAKLLVPYQNRFSGNVYMPGKGLWDATGKVGIGTTDPRYALHSVSTDNTNTTSAFLWGQYYGTLIGVANTTPSYYAFQVASNMNADGTQGTGGFKSLLYVRADGNVGIGTATPGSYKLAVEGIIGARKVKVTQSAWADFVFEQDYQLPSLQEVESYISVNKHLPDVPSAAEVEKEGLDLGEMNKVLLQKVEELTLYLIQQQKEMKEIRSQNNELNERMEKLMNALDKK